MKCYDVVISGAGPAGCSSALYLAQKGYSVLLLDKATFPREKVCGDGLTAASSAILEEMNVMDLVRLRLGPLMVCKGVTLFSPAGTVVQGRLSQAGILTGSIYVIPRKELDDCLIACVKEHSTITVLENTAVTDIIMDGDRARGVRSSGGEWFGRVVIAADGAYSPIASRLNLANKEKKHQGFALRAYFSKVEGLTDSIELHYDKSMLPGYGWIFPAGKQRANVGVGLMTRFKDQRALKQLFERFVAENAFASAKLKHAVMEPGTLRGWPLPFGSFQGKRGRGNVLLTGDAGSFVDPLTGEGIYYALKSGRYAAEAAARALVEEETRAFMHYEELWRKEFLFRKFTLEYALQPLLNNEFLLESLMRFAAKKQKRANLLAGVIGHNLKKRDLLKLIPPFS